MSTAAMTPPSGWAEPVQGTLPLVTGTPCGGAIKLYRHVFSLSRNIDPETGQPRGYAYGFYRTYAKKMKVDVRTIYNWVADLEARGWIARQVVRGIRAFIYPLLDQIPSRESASPRPPEPFVRPERQARPETVGSAAETASPQASEASSLSGVISGVISGGHPYTAPIGASLRLRDTREQQHGASPKRPSADAAAARHMPGGEKRTPFSAFPRSRSLSPDEEGVARSLASLGVYEKALPRLLRMPLPDLWDAMSITLWRRLSGAEIGDGDDLGAYIANQAKNLAARTYKRPKPWRNFLHERGAAQGTPSAVAAIIQAATATTVPARIPSSASARSGPLPLGTPESDRRAARETKRAKQYAENQGLAAPDRALIERLAKHAVGWVDAEAPAGADEEIWRARARQIHAREEYLWFPLDWTPGPPNEN